MWIFFLASGGLSAVLSGSPGNAGAAGTVDLPVVYVDARAPGRGDGSSWGNAFTSLQAALAAYPGAAEIRVAQGTYRPGAPGERGKSFFIGKDLFLRGGYLGYGSPDPDARSGSTVLSGDLRGDDQQGFINIADNSYHVVVILDTCALERFRIGGGNADAHYTVDDPDRAWKGAGAFCQGGGEPTIQDCLFFSSVAGDGERGWGGGMYIGGSPPRLVNCAFKGNAAVWGGGILGSPREVIGCTFEGNHAAENGGGLNGGKMAIVGCRFIGNSADWDGGGIYNLDSSQGPTLTNCLFAFNAAARRGGGMLNDETAPQILNCTFYGNSALQGGGMWNVATGGYGDEIPMSVTNCILWGNSDGEGSGESSQVHGGPAGITYSCVQGWTGALGGAGNMGSDPLFADPDSLDFSLRAGSPAIDAGLAAGAPGIDIQGNPRPCGAGVDMGAYERCGRPFLRVTSSAAGAVGPGEVFVELTSDAPIQAFSMGLAHDPAVVRLTLIDFHHCPAMEGLNGGSGPEFFGADIEAGTAGCGAEVKAGGTAYCLASSFPDTSAIPAGASQPILRLIYEAATGAPDGAVSPIAAVGCLGDAKPWPLVLTIGYVSVVPDVEDGAIIVDRRERRFVRGDANADSSIDISDVVTVLAYLFEDGAGPLTCEDSADGNDDGELDITDAIALLWFLFVGPDPLPPPEACGVDPTPDEVPCASYGRCP